MQVLDELRDVLGGVSDHASTAYSDIEEMIDLLEALIPSNVSEAYRFSDGILQGIRLAQYLHCVERIKIESVLTRLNEELDFDGKV